VPPQNFHFRLHEHDTPDHCSEILNSESADTHNYANITNLRTTMPFKKRIFDPSINSRRSLDTFLVKWTHKTPLKISFGLDCPVFCVDPSTVVGISVITRNLRNMWSDILWEWPPGNKKSWPEDKRRRLLGHLLE
jgi:hypothetical protein